MKILEKHFKKLLIILCLIASPIASAEFRHFNDWTTKEKALYTGHTLVSYIDYSQTKSALSNPCDCYHEGNPIFGKQPHPDTLLATNMLVSAYAYYKVGSSAAPNDFNKIMAVATGLRTVIVIKNDRVGISWSVGF